MESLSREELIALLQKQAEQIEKLISMTLALRRQIEELKRKGYRAAAPFSNGTPTQNPKRPGRKAGQGVFTNRTAPAPETITTLTTVSVTVTACPCCGGVLEPEGEEFVTITDIPEMPKPVIAGYMMGRSRCATCHHRVRSEHPDVAADQRGATAHRLGPRVTSTAHWLHYGIGVPQRKLPGVFKELFGLHVTQSRWSNRHSTSPKARWRMCMPRCAKNCRPPRGCIAPTPDGRSLAARHG